MSSSIARKFRFVSPGIFLREIDNSHIPRLPDAMGPTIIGRFAQGPAMRPHKIRSLAEFVETFGNPIPGASSGDVWREGNKTGPTYAAYAAFAWLNAGEAPVNIMRLLGDEHDQNDGTVLGSAGWTTTKPGTPSTAVSAIGASTDADMAGTNVNGGAYGLWIIPSGSDMQNIAGSSLGTGSLAAIWYIREGAVVLKGKQTSNQLQSAVTAITGNAVMIHSEDSSYTFQAQILNGTYSPLYTTKFNFDRTSDNYIRKVFNTDPIITNTSVVDSTTVKEGKGKYWLGETYESNLFNVVGSSGDSYGVILPIHSGTINDDAHGSGSAVVGYEDHLEGFKNPESGWFFSQDLSTNNADYAAERMTKVFKFHGIDAGEWLQNNIKISIADIKASTSLSNPYGTFTVQLRRASDSDNVPVILEQYTNCNLNPASADYVAAKIGDKYMSFDYSTNRLREYGQYNNQSSFIRIEMNPSVENGTADPEVLPFGVFGPIRPFSWRVRSCDGGDGATGTPFLKIEKHANDDDCVRRTPADGKSEATITIAVGTVDNIGAGDVITLVSTDGTTITCTLNGVGGTTTSAATDGNVEGATYASSMADALQATAQASTIATAINYSNYFTATNSANVVTVTQATGGRTGNTTITITELGATGMAKTDFVGGADLIGTFVTVDKDLIASNYDRDGLTSITFGEAQVKSDGTTGAGSAGQYRYTASYEFPRTLFRISASDGGIGNPKNAYFGLQTGVTHTDVSFDTGYGDYLRRLPAGYGQVDTITGPPTDRAYSWVFSLDDVKTVNYDGSLYSIAKSAYFRSGSRRDGDSLTALSSSYKQILTEGYDRFTTPLYGGFDGWDVYEAEPLANARISSTDTQYTNYAYNTVKRAIDTCADPEFVEMNMMAVPGLTAKNLTKHLIETCEARADAMAVIDIEDVYTPFTENTNSFQSNVGSVSSAISSLRSRDINSSYAAAYYPWVQIRDPNTSKLVWTPPSVVALGTYASSEAKSELWFAPAGFTRGGLTDGAGGLQAVKVTERVVRKDRDKLYTANINPIATFPTEGIVVFGQKTLQVTPSALDRINVRRLMIYLKKEVSRMAATILFDQNVQATWTRFKNKVEPFLSSVQTRLGLTEFKVLLDETTTTDDLIDRNILYAKIFLKPARAIEFIAIDFVISRTGASFDD